MEKYELSTYIWKVIWLVGLVIFAIISFNYQTRVQQTVDETYNFIPIIWIDLLISFLFGLYVSLLFVKQWSFNVNHSLLLCVSIPCILLSCAYPLLATLSSFNYLPETITSSSISSLLLKISSSRVLGVISGLSLVLSIINTQSKSDNR